ncbi:MAG TPA: hypothetical protein VM219_06850 [Phycisphaerae bacterium]|nr:hypothetical protein [Phycisphaerae bacterium]
MPTKSKASTDAVPKVGGGQIKIIPKFEQPYHAGLFVGNVTAEEFHLLVGNRTSPGQAEMHWCFVTSLNNAKRLHAMLGRLLAKHEEQWGPIPLNKEPLEPPKQSTRTGTRKRGKKKAKRR